MLPPLIAGKDRACFGVTEPNTGLETLKLQTRAVRKGDRYEITGSKVCRLRYLLSPVFTRAAHIALTDVDFDRAKSQQDSAAGKNKFAIAELRVGHWNGALTNCILSSPRRGFQVDAGAVDILHRL
jgi:hypothetical protein